MAMTPDFTHYTIQQLVDAYYNINRNLYPESFEKLLKEIELRGMTEVDVVNYTQPQETHPKQKYIRNYWMVLLFGVLTFGIYWYYWYYANLEEIGKAFKFEKSEKEITIAKVACVVIIILRFSNLGASGMTGNEETPEELISVISGLLIYLIILYFFENIFMFIYLHAIQVGQEKADVKLLPKFAMFAAYVISTGLPFLSIFTMKPSIMIVSVIVCMLVLVGFYYTLQEQINKIWEAVIDKEII